MKRQYVKPDIQVEAFEASEYIAACWKINCNVPSGYGYYDNNHNGKYDGSRSQDELIINNVRGCGEWHTGVPGVPNDGPKANAMWHENRSGADYEVYFWKQGQSYWGHSNKHFSKVSAAQWETNPNAS